MTAWAALLRAVNVGGTGKLAMADFSRACAAAGFSDISTYIQSGNAVFTSGQDEAGIIAALSAALAAETGFSPGILVRSAAELSALAEADAFPGADPAKIAIAFLESAPTPDLLSLKTPGGEIIRPGARELIIHYPEGMGRSKLRLPKTCTVRNLNTLRKLAGMTANLAAPGTFS